MNNEDLKITEIQWRMFTDDPQDRVKAKCTVILNGEMVINDIRVVNGYERIFVSYPNPYKEKDSKSKKSGCVYPITRACHDRFEKIILDSYYEKLKSMQESKGDGAAAQPEKQPANEEKKIIPDELLSSAG